METYALVFDKHFCCQIVAFSYSGSEPTIQHKALLGAALKRDAAMEQKRCAHVENCVEHALATVAQKQECFTLLRARSSGRCVNGSAW
jgi:hypothetical protein